jgi:hypothetical protein
MSPESVTTLTFILAALVVASAAVLAVLGTRRRAGAILQRWAERNGLQLLDSEMRWFRRGPFFWSGRGQVVYYVSVMDSRGQMHRGWVRCGSFWLGLWRDQAEVRWDTEN